MPKNDLIKHILRKEKFEAAKKRRVFNEKISEESRILRYLKKNKNKENKYLDEKIRLVADSLTSKYNLIFKIVAIFNCNSVIDILNRIIESKNENNLQKFIVKRSEELIYRHIYNFYVS